MKLAPDKVASIHARSIRVRSPVLESQRRPRSVPRHHPEIKKIWDQLNALVEKRGEKPGIEIDEMDIINEATPLKKPSPSVPF